MWKAGTNETGARLSQFCEHYNHLDLAWLRRRKMLTPGTSSSVNWTTGGRPSGSIRIEVGMGTMHLIYRMRTPGEDWQDMREVVRFRDCGRLPGLGECARRPLRIWQKAFTSPVLARSEVSPGVGMAKGRHL
jgi:hypothetical protein